MSTTNGVRASGLASFPASSVNTTVHLYSLSPLVVSDSVFDPGFIVLVVLSPHPGVPPTEIVPGSKQVITTSGVRSEVGEGMTGVVSTGLVAVELGMPACTNFDHRRSLLGHIFIRSSRRAGSRRPS